MSPAARNVLDTVRILETREAGSGSYEVCATALASLDEETRELKVDLDSFVRRFEMRGKDEVLRPPWLPRKDTVKTHVSAGEAPDAAKEIFSSWAARVRKTIPGPGEWTAEAPWLRPAG